MRDDRLLKQVLFGLTELMAKIKEKDPKGDEQTTSWTGARKILYLHLVQNGGG